MTHLFTPLRSVFVTVLTVGMLAIVGCGGDPAPITAASSKYEVAEGDDPGTSSTQIPPADLKAIHGSTVNPTTPEQSPSTPPTGAIRPASDKPEELMEYVSQLESQEPSGNSQEEVIADFQRTQDEIISICERVFAMDVPPEVRLAAARSEVTSLSRMSQLGNPAASQRLEEFVTKLNASEDEALQKMGFQLGFANKMDALGSGKDVDPLTVIEDLNHLITTEAKDARLLQLGNQVAAILEQAGHSQQAIEAFRLMAEAFETVEDERLREAVSGLTERAQLLESDITTMLSEMLQGKDEAAATFVTAAQGLLQAEGVGLVTLDFFQQVAPTLEIAKPEIAREVYTAIETAFKENPNEDLAKLAEQITGSYKKRSSLVGRPFTIEGSDLNGQQFDWTQYKDKIVLVDFWATWCQPCLEEMPNIRENYDRYHAQGFEVVGVNLDEDTQSLQRFMSFQKLPWPSVVGADPTTRGWKNPMVEKCGITSIPFLVLVGRDGNVLATNVRGDALDEKLAELFSAGDTKPAPVGDAKAAPAGDAKAAPAGDAKPADSEKAAATPEPAAPKTPAPKPAANDASDGAKAGSLPRIDQRLPREEGFVGITAPSNSPAGPRQRSNSAASVAEAKTDEGDQSEINPYSPPSGLSAGQLVNFIFSMQEKPLSIQRRPGFAAAIAEAADQVLASNASDQLQIVAAEAKFEVLHQAASLGDDQADRQLDEFVHQMQDDTRVRIAKQVQFFSLERKALRADEIPLAALPGLFDELQTYFDSQKLTDKHLRIASATVHAINRMTDGTAREEYFKKFGTQFAASKDKDLARYGRKIGKAPARPVSELVGKPLELKGITTLGTAFEWETYRGKIVVVDFWATWCGPCRRETPHLQALAKTSDKLAVVAVSLDQDLEAVEKYLEQNQIEWTNLVGDEAMQIASNYGIRAIPTMLVVDAKGNVVAVGNKVSQIQSKVQQLLAG